MPRKRTAVINIRVTETEKRRMERSARLCGLGLSAYLRELAMGHQMRPLGPEAFRGVYNAVENVRRNAKTLAPIQIDMAMRSIEQMILKAYREGGDDCGRDEDMASVCGITKAMLAGILHFKSSQRKDKISSSRRSMIPMFSMPLSSNQRLRIVQRNNFCVKISHQGKGLGVTTVQ